MITFNQPQTKTAKRSFCFGSFPNKYITGTIGDTFNVIGETKTYYITDNTKNNKLPKWIVE